MLGFGRGTLRSCTKDSGFPRLAHAAWDLLPCRRDWASAHTHAGLGLGSNPINRTRPRRGSSRMQHSDRGYPCGPDCHPERVGDCAIPGSVPEVQSGACPWLKAKPLGELVKLQRRTGPNRLPKHSWNLWVHFLFCPQIAAIETG